MGRARRLLREYLLSRPQMLAILPSLMLTAYWTAGETAMLVMTILVPGIFALAGAIGTTPHSLLDGGDPLTGLPGPEAGVAEVDQRIARNPSGQVTSTTIAIGLDGFSSIREQYGHAVADRLVAASADRMRSHLRRDDLLTRLDGPAFGLFMHDSERLDLDSLVAIAERLQAAFDEPFSICANRIYTSVSIGVCPGARSPGRTGSDLIDAARIALDKARESGGAAIRVYAQGMERFHLPRDGRMVDLAAAIEGGRIRPYFQPQVDCRTRKLTGIELLARWRDSDHGVLLPDDFLPEIAAAGLAPKLADLCIRDALAALKDWASAGLDVPSVAVNLPPAILRDPEFGETLRWHLDRFGVAPERLALELAAPAGDVIGDEVVGRNLALIRDLGCRIAIDGFGSNRMSVEQLQSAGVHLLKIGRRSVANIYRDDERRTLVDGIMALARSLHLDTVAVGVENEAEARVLTELGCGGLQGFIVARPMTLEMTTTWIAEAAAAGSADAAATQAESARSLRKTA